MIVLSDWSPPIAIDFVVDRPTLVISEVNYDPSAASVDEQLMGWTESDFEFVEVTNHGDQDASLLGLKITGGISFEFTGAELTSLQPGQRAIVAAPTTRRASPARQTSPAAGGRLQPTRFGRSQVVVYNQSSNNSEAAMMEKHFRLGQQTLAQGKTNLAKHYFRLVSKYGSASLQAQAKIQLAAIADAEQASRLAGP